LSALIQSPHWEIKFRVELVCFVFFCQKNHKAVFFAINLPNKAFFWSKILCLEKSKIRLKKDPQKNFLPSGRNRSIRNTKLIVERGDWTLLSPKKNTLNRLAFFCVRPFYFFGCRRLNKLFFHSPKKVHNMSIFRKSFQPSLRKPFFAPKNSLIPSKIQLRILQQ